MASKKEEVALQAEHQAMHGLEKLMESISEGISFVLMLFDERVTDIYARLDDETRRGLGDLTYEKLFSSTPGKELAKVLVKAIVNRNIESGSNVETVADALRRRCGSFCSPDDVVIFKAQEQLKRASERPADSSAARALLQESLTLFEKVAGNLSFGNLEAAVDEYVKMRYYAGAIRLCLGVAREKDRGNAALAWVNDGRPAGDHRAAAYEQRTVCYDLVHRVLLRLEEAEGAAPESMDGRPTLSATKRAEAHEVVNSSGDEVFHFGLYQWYIDQGWTDRILGIDSPHVVTFLEDLARTGAEHAALLCRFYTHQGQYFKAATVQYELSQSDFRIGIKERINLLSLAKTNANVVSPGVARQQQQGLNHSISGLLEVAHIQDDILERLRVDARIDPQRLVEIEEVLDGKIQGLTEVSSILPFLSTPLQHLHRPPIPSLRKVLLETVLTRPALQRIRRPGRLLRHLPPNLPRGRLPQPDHNIRDLGLPNRPGPRGRRRGRRPRRAPPLRVRLRQDPEHRAPHRLRHRHLPHRGAAPGGLPVRGGPGPGREYRGGSDVARAAVPWGWGVARRCGARAGWRV